MSSATRAATALLDPERELYPSSDGEPMGDTDTHTRVVGELYWTLDDLYRPAEDVYVASNLFIYYEQGNPKARRAPDVMVVKGVPKKERRIFRVWVEGTVPRVVFEALSERTWKEDLEEKRPIYARLRIPEFFMIDAECEYLDEPLRGYRLDGEDYVQIEPNEDGSLTSRELGLRFVMDGIYVRVIDERTSQPLPHRFEIYEQLLAEQERALEERRRAEQERQGAEQDRIAREQQRARADAERARADAEKTRAEEQRLRAEAAEAELARLRKLVEQQQQKPEPGSP